ncbi:dihydrofolate reductase family protein [Gordonia alkaliphila]|uniref:dihydrofolate reductase family protein n=1 Tax=Gordonia alkaliphila TaxID=1053547 RepID=UPI001FF18360|nr:dihydrofolate reductase family protein [Gordonia alkaliphila]MCK0440509.1 dihydrofolate reductase family protein [Gordonia alkaliphila]
MVSTLSRTELLDAYAWPAGPWLRTNFVYSLDASLTRDGVSAGLSGPADSAVLHRLRGGADAVLVGASTAVAENYIGVKLPDAEQQARTARGQGGPPPLVVVTRSGQIGEPSRFLTHTTTGNYLLLTTDDPAAYERAAGHVERSEGTMTLLHAPDGLGQGIGLLHERGLLRILCEGGPHVSGALAAEGLIDELCVTLSPAAGGEGRGGTTPQATDEYTPAFVAAVDHFLFTRWIRRQEGDA